MTYRSLKVICSIQYSRWISRPHFYQTRSAWSVDQGSNKNHSPAYNFTPTVTKFCVMWEGLSLPHDTKFGNCRCKIVDSRSVHSWSLIHGLRWSGLIKVGHGQKHPGSCAFAEAELLRYRKPKRIVQNEKNGCKNPNSSHNYHDENHDEIEFYQVNCGVGKYILLHNNSNLS